MGVVEGGDPPYHPRRFARRWTDFDVVPNVFLPSDKIALVVYTAIVGDRVSSPDAGPLLDLVVLAERMTLHEMARLGDRMPELVSRRLNETTATNRGPQFDSLGCQFCLKGFAI
jgi:hypothetical protein